MTAKTATAQTVPRPAPWSTWLHRGLLRRALILACLGALSTVGAGAKDLSASSLRTAKGFSWISKSSDNFDFFVETDTLAERDIEKIEQRMEESRARLGKLLGATSEQRTQVFIVDSRHRMKELIGFEGNGYANGTVSTMVYNDTIQAVGAHETCHILARSLWGKSHGDWVNEGLAVYSDDQWRGLPLHAVAKWLLDKGELVPIANLTKDGWSKKYPDMITYPELGSFVKFLYEKYGLEAVKNLWQHGVKEAVRAFGKSLSELEDEWRTELAKVDASSIQYKIR